MAAAAMTRRPLGPEAARPARIINEAPAPPTKYPVVRCHVSGVQRAANNPAVVAPARTKPVEFADISAQYSSAFAPQDGHSPNGSEKLIGSPPANP
jgi:hypothetical protein